SAGEAPAPHYAPLSPPASIERVIDLCVRERLVWTGAGRIRSDRAASVAVDVKVKTVRRLQRDPIAVRDRTIEIDSAELVNAERLIGADRCRIRRYETASAVLRRQIERRIRPALDRDRIAFIESPAIEIDDVEIRRVITGRCTRRNDGLSITSAAARVHVIHPVGREERHARLNAGRELRGRVDETVAERVIRLITTDVIEIAREVPRIELTCGELETAGVTRRESITLIEP